VTYKPKEELEALVNGATDPIAKLLRQIQLLFARGSVELKSQHHFKNVKFTTVEDLLTAAYGKH
jgi:hypothetical protein